MRLLAAALLALAAAGCLAGAQGGITITGPPPITEGPIPSPFEAEEPPALEPTDTPDLFSAPSLGPNVYFHESDKLWYRYAYRRWYQAFRWNGNWFVLEEPPEILSERELVKPKREDLPTLPEYED